MSDLSAFTPEEKDLLIGVFFRTGKWIAMVDETGDYSADVAEEKQLLACLGRLKREIKQADIVAEIASEAARRQGDWRNSDTDAQQILHDVRICGEMINMRLGQDALFTYKIMRVNRRRMTWPGRIRFSSMCATFFTIRLIALLRNSSISRIGKRKPLNNCQQRLKI